MGTLGQNATAILAATALAGGLSNAEAAMLRIDCGSQFCKAFPEVEGGQRVLYMEASSPTRDLQNEKILTEALMESKDYFLRHGRIDLDHATVWQAIRDKQLDADNPYLKEIGQPKDVIKKIEKGEPSVWVRAEIYQSKQPNKVTDAADWFWDTLRIQPPMVWYPSVAGTLLPGGRTESVENGQKVGIIKSLRWHSIGLTRTPVNSGLSAIATVPLGAFCKALRGETMTSAFEAFANVSAPIPDDADNALNRAGIRVPPALISSNPVGDMTPDKLALIEQSICYGIVNGATTDAWLSDLGPNGISPDEGLAVLIAMFDTSRTHGGV